MKKERMTIHHLAVCYCLLKKEKGGRTGAVGGGSMTETLNHVQAFYENKGAAGGYSQAFVYGSRNAFARPFEQYPFGFRAGLDENVEKYDLSETLTLCYSILDDFLPENEENHRPEEMKDVYRLVLISDYPLNTDSDAADMLMHRLNALKKRCDFKIVYADSTGSNPPGNMENIIDFYGCEEDAE